MNEEPTNTSTGSQLGQAKRRLLFLTAFVVVVVDLVAKVLAERRLSETSVDLGLLRLQLAHNDGVAFSLGNALPAWTVVALTATLTAAIGIYGWRHAPTTNRVQLLAGAAILGGATANVIDRAADGVVTDYLHTNWWPTFNLADAFLVVGVVILIAGQLHTERRSNPPAVPAPEHDAPDTSDDS